MTNKGLQIELPLLPIMKDTREHPSGYTHLAFPRCRRENDLHQSIAIPFTRTVAGTLTSGHDSYRAFSADLIAADHDSLMQAREQKVYIHGSGLFWRAENSSIYNRCIIQNF